MSMKIEIPNNVEVEIHGDLVRVKGSLGSNERRFNESLLKLSKENNTVSIDASEYKTLRKKALMAINSFAKELKNDVKGVNKHFEVQMEGISAHFPMTFETKEKIVSIKNMLGERYPRFAKIIGNTKIEIKEKNLRIYGTRLEDVTQTAANIKKICKIRKKDIRVFQDGVYYLR